MNAAIEADAAVWDAVSLAAHMRAIGALGAAAAMEALARDREARADRIWTMAERALSAQALAGRSASFTVR